MCINAKVRSLLTFFVCTKKVTKKCTSLLFYEKKDAKKETCRFIAFRSYIIKIDIN